MQMRLDQQLVVTLIGPSGAGKSTLLNALAGVDHLSPTGLQRPTTQNLVVLSNNGEAARQLFESFEQRPGTDQIQPGGGNALPGHSRGYAGHRQHGARRSHGPSLCRFGSIGCAALRL